VGQKNLEKYAVTLSDVQFQRGSTPKTWLIHWNAGQWSGECQATIQDLSCARTHANAREADERERGVVVRAVITIIELSVGFLQLDLLPLIELVYVSTCQ
jgi:hypothetical protein